MKTINSQKLNEALQLLESRIRREGGDPVDLVVCGGSALIAVNLVSRTTKDVDIIALRNIDSELIDPDPLPGYLIDAAVTVSRVLNLPEDWLNTGPSDLFRMGLPDKIESRFIRREFGSHLTVHFISRIDQIYFKLYASVDRGGYHIDDLVALKPTENEILEAAKWSQTHDVSEGYAMLLRELLSELGYENAAAGI